MNNVSPPRVAILGFMLESNAFAPPATEADFRSRCYLEGDVIVEEARKTISSVHMETSGFVHAMDATGPWEPAPIIVTDCEPAGPVDHVFFERTLSVMGERLAACGRIDAVYIANHGAMVSTETTDPDGEMFQRIRVLVGPDVPIVVTLGTCMPTSPSGWPTCRMSLLATSQTRMWTCTSVARKPPFAFEPCWAVSRPTRCWCDSP